MEGNGENLSMHREEWRTSKGVRAGVLNLGTECLKRGSESA